MANPTSNFNWQMPTSTDLVTDLPADFEVFGQAVDTSLADLKGGTTGQILSKASNTDMDFTWTAATTGDITGVTAGTGISGGGTSGDVTITNSMATAIDAKGDLIAGTAADTFSRIAVGANDTVLTADSSTATGLKWATVPSGGMTLLSTTTLTGASVTVSSISSSYVNLFIVFEKLYPATNGSRIRFRLNGSTTASNYNYQPSGDNFFNFPVSTPSNGTNGQLGNANLTIFNYADATTWKQYYLTQSTTQQADDNNWVGGEKGSESWTSINAINSITIFASSGNINGTMLIYGVK
jgi:hypothetical protein